MSTGTKPLIGLVGRRRLGAGIVDFPDILDRTPVDLYIADYATAVLAAGGLPVHLPMDADPADYVPYLHGIVLSGGADVAPERYGDRPDGNGAYEAERDALELAVLDHAIPADLPVLGICRGLQVINVHAGGTLHQHVPAHSRFDLPTDARVHPIRFEAESRLGALYGARADVDVNSLHHQTVDRLGDGLRATAWDPDGVVEGVERVDGDVLAVQWHPEMLPGREPVFDWLIERAGQQIERASDAT